MKILTEEQRRQYCKAYGDEYIKNLNDLYNLTPNMIERLLQAQAELTRDELAEPYKKLMNEMGVRESGTIEYPYLPDGLLRKRDFIFEGEHGGIIHVTERANSMAGSMTALREHGYIQIG